MTYDEAIKKVEETGKCPNCGSDCITAHCDYLFLCADCGCIFECDENGNIIDEE